MLAESSSNMVKAYTREQLETEAEIHLAVLDCDIDPSEQCGEADAAEIREQYNSGNEWAWCVVRVHASIDVDGETIEGGAEVLGGCSYASERDFKGCAYYSGMVSVALDNLYDALPDGEREPTGAYYVDDAQGVEVRDENGLFVAAFGNADDAALFVACVNAHDTLTAALRTLRALTDPESHGDVALACYAADEALKRAESN